MRVQYSNNKEINCIWTFFVISLLYCIPYMYSGRPSCLRVISHLIKLQFSASLNEGHTELWKQKLGSYHSRAEDIRFQTRPGTRPARGEMDCSGLVREISCWRVISYPIKLQFSASLNERHTELRKKELGLYHFRSRRY